MAVSLKKGQRVDLTKNDPGLSKLMIGLGWDPVKSGGKGLMGGLFGGGSAPNIDCDASVLMLDENGKIRDKKDIVYFANLKSKCGAVIHSGDNLTGDGDGDDEQVLVELSSVSPKTSKLVFVVNIYACEKRKQDFGMIQNAFIRAVDANRNNEILRYNLTDDYSGATSLIVGELYRHGGQWKFAAIGQGTRDTSISSIVKKYM
ncbi:MAG: TerD family protein [Anaeromicrobium sp.]|jgi:stress response protein SCP2|uniref:TerD family protein n=1 Tax=Anaeromicrobium sp. TaxID=1929132 RepID=UPI0025FD1E13|nr:TerD family protein [Anaeromicrobium sp.]MCT4592853.1 TerD family protein [Anaeromicrobium sp.]